MTPALWATVPMLVSLGAWLLAAAVPGGGYDSRAPLTAGAAVVIILWLCCTIAVTVGGYRIGRLLAPRRSQRVRSDPVTVELSVQRILVTFAAAGTLYAYSRAGGVQAAFAALVAHSANDLKAGISEGVGIGTLRYAAIPAAALAMKRIFTRRALSVLDLACIGVLGLVAILSSRLSLVMAGVMFIYLIRASIRVSLGRLVIGTIIGAITVFMVTAPLNYSRNANYYATYGVTNAVEMNFLQIQAYLSTPSQAMVVVADRIYSRVVTKHPESAADLLLPTYLQSDVAATINTSLLRYGGDADVSGGFTTNSVFADVWSAGGVFGLATALFAAWAAAFAIGALSRSTGSLALVPATLLYCFAEWWRVYMFNAGIIHFIVIAVLAAVSLAALLLAKSPHRRPRAPALQSVGRWAGKPQARLAAAGDSRNDPVPGP